jgi:16S rRNA (uracil1498-N3)-methyltransferase
MARRRFFVEEVREGRAALRGDDARHLWQVLRTEPGQRYELSDNTTAYLAEIETVRRDEVSFRIVEELASSEPPLRLTLLLALIKFDRFEWATEKATELGVDGIIPVSAGRSEKGLERAAVSRRPRWQRIAREASQQARRLRLPQICGPMPLATAIETSSGLRYFLDEDGGRPLLAALPPNRVRGDAVCLLTGPEGGWLDSERQLALGAGWTPVTLGPSILRAETAAIAGISVLTSAWLTVSLVD